MQIAETIVRHEGVSYAAANRRALELLEMVQIPSAARRLKAYPHEMSGGMRQRAMIALALSCRPSVLLADEPTTALDVTVQIQIILLLRQLQQELGMAVVFVTHDVGVAVEVADRIAVMYAGRFVEVGPTEAVIDGAGASLHGRAADLDRAWLGVRASGWTRFPACRPTCARFPKGAASRRAAGSPRTGAALSMPPEFAVAPEHMTRCLRVAAREIDLAGADPQRAQHSPLARSQWRRDR